MIDILPYRFDNDSSKSLFGLRSRTSLHWIPLQHIHAPEQEKIRHICHYSAKTTSIYLLTRGNEQFESDAGYWASSCLGSLRVICLSNPCFICCREISLTRLRPSVCTNTLAICSLGLGFFARETRGQRKNIYNAERGGFRGKGVGGLQVMEKRLGTSQVRHYLRRNFYFLLLFEIAMRKKKAALHQNYLEERPGVITEYAS